MLGLWWWDLMVGCGLDMVRLDVRDGRVDRGFMVVDYLWLERNY